MRFTASSLVFVYLLHDYNSGGANAWTTTAPSRQQQQQQQRPSSSSMTGPLNYISPASETELTSIDANRDIFLKLNNVVPLESKWISSPQWDRLAREYAAQALEPIFLPFLAKEEGHLAADDDAIISTAVKKAVQSLPSDEMTKDELIWMKDKLQELIAGTWQMRFQYVHFWKISNPFTKSFDESNKKMMIRDLVSYNSNELLQCKSFLDDINWPNDTFEQYISVRYSIPTTKVNSWIHQFGKDETERMAKELRFC